MGVGQKRRHFFRNANRGSSCYKGQKVDARGRTSSVFRGHVKEELVRTRRDWRGKRAFLELDKIELTGTQWNLSHTKKRGYREGEMVGVTGGSM